MIFDGDRPTNTSPGGCEYTVAPEPERTGFGSVVPDTRRTDDHNGSEPDGRVL